MTLPFTAGDAAPGNGPGLSPAAGAAPGNGLPLCATAGDAAPGDHSARPASGGGIPVTAGGDTLEDPAAPAFPPALRALPGLSALPPDRIRPPRALVVADITRPLTLIQGRRLQLAAEAGGATGLLLIPEGKGSPAAEMRRQVGPVPVPGSDTQGSTGLRCCLIKNKSEICSSWMVDLGGIAPPFPAVPPPDERAGAARRRRRPLPSPAGTAAPNGWPA